MSFASAMAAPETPEEAVERLTLSKRAKGFRLEALHTYTDAEGKAVYWRIRMSKPGAEKLIRPMSWSEDKGYESKEPSFPHGKPLYRLHELMQADEVIVCEGEWCADHLAALGLVATTSGGSSSADKADWSPLAGKQVIIWPDNDDPGARYAAAVAQAAYKAGARRVERLVVSDLPPKGDAVDWLATNPDATAADVLALPRHTEVREAAEASKYEDVVQLTRASDVVPEPIDWLWYGWLAAGKLHVLAGAPGTGKSSLATAIAAAISRGGTWPDGTPACARDVVIWSGEDSAGDTIVPRLRACGADMERIHIISHVGTGAEKRGFDPANDVDALCAALRRMKVPVGLLIIDPIVSAVSGDSHKNSEVRRGLQSLVDLAEEFGCALLGISHFTKGTQGRDPVERVTGSLAFGALARIVLAAAKLRSEPGQPDDRRILARAKSNIGPDSGGFYYTLDRVELDDFPGVQGQRVVWGGAIDGAARDLLDQADGVGGSERRAPARVGAEAFLREVLRDGPAPSSEVEAQAEARDISESALKRARKSLGVLSEKEGVGKDGRWMMSLPPPPPPKPAKF